MEDLPTLDALLIHLPGITAFLPTLLIQGRLLILLHYYCIIIVLLLHYCIASSSYFLQSSISPFLLSSTFSPPFESIYGLLGLFSRSSFTSSLQLGLFNKG
jgi:hypothetical protein